MAERDHIDYAFLLANARAGIALGVPGFIHLDQPIGLWNYLRIANDVAAQASGRLVDWGCGFGQMTYLLRQRGLHVTPFDIGAEEAALPDIPICRELGVVRTQHPTRLPFETASFDAVLSCGVLEHVDEYSQPGNEMKSLQEMRRVLRPGGALLIYQLPQVHAWQEAVIRRFHLGYSHPRRYTETEIRRMLAETGYRVRRVRRANLIPKNLTGVPAPMRRWYSLAARPLIAVDGVLSQIPGLNQFAGVLEITAEAAP